MSVHDALIDLHNILNYPNEEGLCNGFSVRWLEASLLGKEEQQRFEKRIKLIALTPLSELLDAIDEARAKKGKDLTEKDYELLDILSFYDSLTLFHIPADWAFIFKRHFLSQEDVEDISIIASSDEIKKRGGLKQLYSEPLILTVKEIETYLDELSQLFNTSDALSKEPIGILLGSEDHTIALTYQPGVGWNFRDINQTPFDPSQAPFTSQKIAQAIKNGFTYKKISPYSAFNAQVILTKNDPRCNTLEAQLKEFKKTHLINKETAARKTDSINLVYIAAQHGHLEEVKKLIQTGAELNLCDDDNTTPISIAAHNGYTEIVKVLIDAKVNLDQADDFNTTPVWAAARYGHTKIVELLAQAGAVLNMANTNRQSPLWIAAKKGHIEIVQLLIQCHAKLHEADAKGRTPLWIAAKYGHSEIIEILLKHGAKIDEKDNNGISPLLIAVNNGHAEAVKTLVQAGVDLSQVDENGKTAMWVAANNGCTKVIKELAHLNPDLLNNKDTEGVTPLLIAAKKGDAESVELLTQYKDKIDLNQTLQGMTAIFIAAQEGHFMTVKKLLEAHVDYTLPFRRTVNDLKRFALIKKGADLRQKIETIIQGKSGSDEVLLTPYDIANIMGHDKIATLIKEYEVKQSLSQTNLLKSLNQSFFSIKSASVHSPKNLISDTKEAPELDGF
ncbi:ankyrin repeat domain-containing protein [Legionella gresilensis]|uniref:ankyrin repeat domain-containing protein n=1 Tax=Legionella gresilensis TaxID=91823 RepID=UPI0010415EDB|nr:ankyrin repeat domain-containing protein [Legionella gresilensis]